VGVFDSHGSVRAFFFQLFVFSPFSEGRLFVLPSAGYVSFYENFSLPGL